MIEEPTKRLEITFQFWKLYHSACARDLHKFCGLCHDQNGTDGEGGTLIASAYSMAIFSPNTNYNNYACGLSLVS